MPRLKYENQNYMFRIPSNHSYLFETVFLDHVNLSVSVLKYMSVPTFIVANGFNV